MPRETPARREGLTIVEEVIGMIGAGGVQASGR
jgi:hypothetical protein